MSMKKILMAAVAASAISAAGSAGAVTLSGSTVGDIGVGLTPLTVISGTVLAPVSTPYYLADEFKYATMPQGTVTLAASLNNGAISSGQYLVTYELQGAGQFDSSVSPASINQLTFTGLSNPNSAFPTTSVVLQSATATKVVFFLTVGAGDILQGLNYQAPVAMTSIGEVKAQVSIEFAANGAAIDSNKASGFQTIIKNTKSFYAKIGSYPATNAKASTVSDFRQYLAGANVNSTLQTASIGSIQFTTYVPSDAAGGVVFNNLSAIYNVAGNISDTSDLAPGATATFTAGTTGTNERLVLGTNAAVGAAIPSTVISTAIALSTLGGTSLVTSVAPVATTSYLLQATTTSSDTVGDRLAYVMPNYVALAKPALVSTTHNQVAAPDQLTLGGVDYEGVTLNAAWVGDGTNGYDFRIRIGNQSATPLGQVKVVLINPTGTPTVTSYNFATTVPGLGELNITSAQLKAAFGAFGRSDMKIVVQGNEDVVSAKMRIINGATGVANEQTLGFGIKVAQDRQPYN